jgi:hypothetical protein
MEGKTIRGGIVARYQSTSEFRKLAKKQRESITAVDVARAPTMSVRHAR